LVKDIIEPLNIFQQHLNGINIENLNELKKFVTSTSEARANTEKMKKKYFDACKLAQEQEAIFMKTISKREKNQCTDEELNSANGILYNPLFYFPF